MEYQGDWNIGAVLKYETPHGETCEASNAVQAEAKVFNSDAKSGDDKGLWVGTHC